MDATVLPWNPAKVDLADMRFERDRTPPKPYRNVVVEGWDTETDPRGYAWLLSSSEECRVVESWEDIVDFLLNRRFRENRNFWWNLDFDVTAMIKWDAEVWYQLTTDGHHVTDDGLKLMYLPKKMLKLTRGKHTSMHYDIFQFYNCGLAFAAKEYLGMEQHEVKNLRAQLWELVRTGELPLESAMDYCRWDAARTKDLASRYIGGLHKVGLFPKHFISKGNLAEHSFRIHGDIPTWRDVPYHVNRLAWAAYRGGWFDLWKKGSMDVHKYDIKSAYPALQRMLPDFREGEWVDYYEPKSFVGFVSCVIQAKKGTPEMLSAWYRSNHIYPQLDIPVKVVLTNMEYDFLRTRAHIEPLVSRSFVPNDNAGYPWRDVIDRFLKLKDAASDDPPAYAASKEVVNSSYGKTCQVVRKEEKTARRQRRFYYEAGKIFCPAAASTITAGCRVMVAEAVAHCLDDVVMTATDSVATLRPLKLDIGSTVGQWELETYDVDGDGSKVDVPKAGLFVKPGVYQIEGKKASTRGFKPEMLPPDKKGKRKPQPLRWYLDRDGDKFEVDWVSPVSSRMAVHRKTYSKANVFEPIRREIGCNDARRLWDERVELRDLLTRRIDSKPVPFSFMGMV